MDDRADVIVVGAGQAGLGTAKVLSDTGLEVVVLERGRIGETWLSQRWASFVLNTPNWMNGLPRSPYRGDDPDGFMTHTQLVETFCDYVDAFELDVRTGVSVTRASDSGEPTDRFTIEADTADGPLVMSCSHLVVASGIARSPSIPPVAAKLPDDILQLSAGSYDSPGSLPNGAVLVVGGGQSGGQIVEDLLEAGRTVYFSISRVGRVPRRYRGRDFMYWMLELGIWDIPTAEAEPDQMTAPNPLTSGVGPRGHTISFQQLAANGARLLGRLRDVADGDVITDNNVIEHVRFADEFSDGLKDKIDQYIVESGIEAEDAAFDPADEPLRDDATFDFETRLNLSAAGVQTVIWCTGFTGDFSWIDLPVTDELGQPRHTRGVSEVPGVYFIGFPWLSSRKSGVVYGIEDDANHIAAAITSGLS